MSPKRRKVKHYNAPGHIHELTFSCYRKIPLLSRDRCRNWLAESIAAAKVKHDFRVIAYVVMPDHVHLLISPEARDYEIAGILKSIKQSVGGRAKNWLAKNNSPYLEKLTCHRAGEKVFRFWQKGCGYDRNIVNRKALLRVMDYLHNNPVRRKLVATPTDWEWSSARWYERREKGPIGIDPIPW